MEAGATVWSRVFQLVQGKVSVLTTQISDDSDHLRVTLEGEIDAETRGLLDEAVACFEPGRHRRIELDLSAVTFVDSSGIGSLVEARRVADAAGAQILLVEPSHPVVRVLTLVGLDGYFALA